MSNNKSIFQIFIISSLIFFISGVLDGQNLNIEKFQYIFPVPSSKLNSAKTNIIIRFGEAFDLPALSKNPLKITGSIKGEYTGRTILSEDNRTLLFYPDNEFRNGEKITVLLNENLSTISNKHIPMLRYYFKISQKNLNQLEKREIIKKYLDSNKKDQQISKSSWENRTVKNFFVQKDSLPGDFPEIFLDTIANATPGYLFFTPFTFPSSRPTYLIITDNYGVPIYYKKASQLTFDFKKQPTGVLTYFDGSTGSFHVMDSSYRLIEDLQMKDGYYADLHDILILENNHVIMFDYDLQMYAMDTVIQGGSTNATVIGLVIQELDQNRDVVFQWRSWDHFKITDATFDIDLTDSTELDYVHGNAVEMDYDGNILISSRHMDEITKISRETGEIIWRWGGKYCKNNEFTFINDPEGFSHQHDVRRLSNGNITLFDNGNLHNPPYTRIAEYQLDEKNKLAFLVWEYRNNPEIFTAFMGSSRRFENHNTFIGWGSSPSPAISEVNAEGEIQLQLSFPDTLINYRAFKYPWKTNLFTVSPDPLFFIFSNRDDLIRKSFIVKNNSDQEIQINGLLNRNSVFNPDVKLPMKIPPLDSISIDIVFRARGILNYSDTLYVQWNKENERITQVLTLIAGTDSNIISAVKNNIHPHDFLLEQNYPNPFNPSTVIGYRIAVLTHVQIKVYDLLGREISVLVNEEKSPGNYKVEFSADRLASGVYYYTLTAGNFKLTKKMLILK